VEVEDFYKSKKTGLTTSKWRSAEVIATSGNGNYVQIHFQDWDPRWDEWIDLSEEGCRIRAVTSPTSSQYPTHSSHSSTSSSSSHDLQINSPRQQAYQDKRRKSLPSSFNGLTDTIGSSIHNHSHKHSIQERKNQFKIRQSSFPPQSTRRKRRVSSESIFMEGLHRLGFGIFPVDADGNCLFRSVSHQVLSNLLKVVWFE